MTVAELWARLGVLIDQGEGEKPVSMEGCCCYSDPGEIVVTDFAVELHQATTEHPRTQEL